MTDERHQFLSWALRDNTDAITFCESLLCVAHLWDDLVDGDVTLDAEQINRAFWLALIEMPGNPFYQRHHTRLSPVIRRAASDWMDANTLERMDAHGRTLAFVLRDAVHGVIVEAAYIVGGYDWMREVSIEVRDHWHDETLSEYLADLEARQT